MKSIVARLIISALSFLIFTWGSTVYYMKYIHDVGGTYWSLGIFGLPLVLLIIWSIDFYLKRLPWFSNRPGVLTFVDSLLAVALYYPGFIVIWGAIYVLGVA